MSGRIFSSRAGALTLGIGAALLAALLLVVYLRSYRNSVRSSAEPASVLVAKRLIPKGTAGTLIAQQGLYQVTRIPKNQLKDGALSDPAAVQGRITSSDVYPGQQFTVADFAGQASTSLSAQISGSQRAIAISLDGAHGLIGPLQPGDHVDAYVNLGGQNGSILKFLASDILVLSVPGAGKSGSSSNVVLRVPAGRAADFALAGDSGKIWLTLRPQANASVTPRADSSIPALLAGR
ncbi:MAG: Flp pilus assembly protein CpaB [Gaiellaceae bacterium]